MCMCIGANKIDGKEKKMLLLHTVEDMRKKEDGSAVGQSVEVIFINGDYCEDITGVKFIGVNPNDFVGKELHISRNRKGFVNAVEICE